MTGHLIRSLILGALALLGVAMVATSLLVLKPRTEISVSEAVQALPDVPERVIQAPLSCSEAYTIECVAPIAVAQSSSWEGRIEFESIGSIHGLWDGWSSRLAFRDRRIRSTAGDSHRDSWGETIVEIGDEITREHFTPSILAELRSVPSELLHTRLDGRARVEVEYPVFAAEGGYLNTQRSLERRVRFFVVSRDEAATLSGLASEAPPGRTQLLILGALLALISGFAWLATFETDTRGSQHVKIRWAIMDHPGLTAAEIAAKTEIALPIVESTLAGMVETGEVTPLAAGRGTRYRLAGPFQ